MRYYVTFSRDVVEYASIEVVAESKEEAERKAKDELEENGAGELDWDYASRDKPDVLSVETEEEFLSI